MLLSFERTIIAGAFAFRIPRATLLLFIGLEQVVLPESKNMSKRTIGVPQELGRSGRLHGRKPGWGYRVTNPRPAARHSVAAGDTKAAGCARGIAKRRQRSAARRAAGSRNALIVPLKQVTRPGGPCGGKRGVGRQTRSRETCGTHRGSLTRHRHLIE